MTVNPKGIIPYVLLIVLALMTGSPWWIAGAAAWYVVIELIL